MIILVNFKIILNCVIECGMFYLCCVRFISFIDWFDKVIKIFYGGIEGFFFWKVYWLSFYVFLYINGCYGGVINIVCFVE